MSSTRVVCPRCLRPPVVCYCADLPALPAPRTRVLILQHPRERRIGVGTGRMAHLALPGSALRVGLDFARDPVVGAMLDGAHVLFPGPRAAPIEALRERPPATLIVLDGSWSLARKLMTRNPFLAELPRVAFAPPEPSRYRIRAQPAAHCVSTIEALAHALAVVEPAGDAYRALLQPFLAMVERQVRFEQEVRSSRHAGRRPRARRAATLPERLAALAPRLVCAQGEANAWPARHPGRPPAELVHWSAVRVATGERLSLTIAPRAPLAPSTPRYLETPADELRAGLSPEEAAARWRAWLRPEDALAVWGTYHVNLGATIGFPIPADLIDLRPALAHHLRQRSGLADEALEALGAPLPVADAPGRCARRLAELRAIVGVLLRGTPRDD